ncbi:single-stranded DNA-binding protein [Nakamurella aerolata]|uniref:Single-stranded DNA-binding protein n=1 Tax=Nakamurella aerolata TaxID=1656892 RepID=A0A849A998_9ACTN|nr:single-stranded DNA-binding protein [Nakamurella aerolata]NNG37119.1 single-stranded DNA-binding protein [Nakamurella aerolata]
MTIVTTVVGNLADAPRISENGNSQRANLRVISNDGYYDRARNEWRARPGTGVDVVCWGHLAHNVAGSLHRGDSVVVTGRLEQYSWEDKDGARRSRMQLVAEAIGPNLRWGVARLSRVENAADKVSPDPWRDASPGAADAESDGDGAESDPDGTDGTDGTGSTDGTDGTDTGGSDDSAAADDDAELTLVGSTPAPF